MPDAPVPTPAKNSEPAKGRNKAEPSESDASDTAAPAPVPANKPVLTIALGAFSAALLIIALVLWGEVSARDATIVQNKNRSDQVQADAVLLLAQVNADKTATALLQKKFDDTKAESNQHKADLDKAIASAADLQSRLDKATAVST